MEEPQTSTPQAETIDGVVLSHDKLLDELNKKQQWITKTIEAIKFSQKHPSGYGFKIKYNPYPIKSSEGSDICQLCVEYAGDSVNEIEAPDQFIADHQCIEIRTYQLEDKVLIQLSAAKIDVFGDVSGRSEIYYLLDMDRHSLSRLGSMEDICERIILITDALGYPLPDVWMRKINKDQNRGKYPKESIFTQDRELFTAVCVHT